MTGRRRAVVLGLSVLWAVVGCEDDDGPPEFRRPVAVDVEPVTTARVTSTPAGIDCDRAYLRLGNNVDTRDRECYNSFSSGDNVTLDADVSEGWAIERWESSLASDRAAACGTSRQCGGMGVTGNATNIVRLVLREAENSCPNITVPPFSSLGLKTAPRPGPAPPVPDNPTAWDGTNYLVDPDFEDQLVFSGSGPTATGYWAFDQAWSAPGGQQGITPHSGGRMLHFVSSSGDGTASTTTASEQIQLVDVSALRTRIDAGQVEVEASAFFNRVAAGGCTRIDNAFGIRVSAHIGIPTNFNVDQGFDQASITADDDPGTWQPATATLVLPPNTTHVSVRVFINEGAANNDLGYPEFHGHYADNTRLTVRSR